MTAPNSTVLDQLLSDHLLACEMKPVEVAPNEIVHVTGTQEPVRDQLDDRARMLLAIGWLKIEIVQPALPATEWADRVVTLQQAARAWLKQAGDAASQADREQVRWVVEKTRSRESKQQITQRVWLAMVMVGLGHRGLSFDSDGQLLWDKGLAGRIGVGPDAVLDLAAGQDSREIYTASFRQPDGTITRGKGRQRWYIYRLTLDRAADVLFERRAKRVSEKVALIVGSETHATKPSLPRDFYGGDEFQQACIDAQDQQFSHILVLSPEHGVISLDDTVPNDQPWEEIMERRIWVWQMLAMQRLGYYLLGEPRLQVPKSKDVSWWAWLNPESTYEITLFGSGFAVQILIDLMVRSRTRAPQSYPTLSLVEQRPGYAIGDLDEGFAFEDFEEDEDPFDLDDDSDYETALQDIDQLLEWSSEFVSLVNIYVAPVSETWELAPDEALIPIRLLADMGMDIEDLLDLLTDITLVLDKPFPITMLIGAHTTVSLLLQVTHSLVHEEHEAVVEIITAFPEPVMRQYIENVLQETTQEDRLCACLTLTEQVHLIAMSVPPATADQLLVWLQTYISSKMRQRILGNSDEETPL